MLNKRATCAALLWLLMMAFAMRVLGQALQRWAPQPLLPPFDAFQGSNLPYWLLLSVQLVILVVMTIVCRRVQTGSLAPSARAWSSPRYTGSSGTPPTNAVHRSVPPLVENSHVSSPTCS